MLERQEDWTLFERLPATSHTTSTRPQGGDDSQYYGEYDGPYDDDWHERDYADDSFGHDWSGGYAERFAYNE